MEPSTTYQLHFLVSVLKKHSVKLKKMRFDIHVRMLLPWKKKRNVEAIKGWIWAKLILACLSSLNYNLVHILKLKVKVVQEDDSGDKF